MNILNYWRLLTGHVFNNNSKAQLLGYMETLCQTFKWTAGAALQIFYYAANFVHPLFGFISCWFTGKNELQYVLEKKIPKHDRVLQVEAILRKWKVFDFETISKCSLTEIYKTLATLCSENNLHNRKLKIRLKYCLQKIIAYEKLLKDVEDVRMIHYNPYDKAHESQLLKLSSLLKPESQISAIDPRWVELGFQGKDPSTDFRGMGLLGLQQLIYMCETEQQKSQAMLSRSLNPRHGYPFAIVGINMSFLTRELLREGHLKSFFYAKSTCKFPMQDLHDVYRYCFYRFDQLWAIYKPENEMAFGEIRAQLKADLLSELRAGNTGKQFLKAGKMSDVLDVYDAEVKANASALYDICEKINPFLADMACLAEKGFCMLKDCIEKGLDLEKPNEEAVARHLFHIFHLMDSFRHVKRRAICNQYFNHVCAIMDSLPALTWMSVESNPVAFIQDIIEIAKFYTDRILKEFSQKEDALHVQFVEQWLKTLESLKAFVQKYYANGFTWKKVLPGLSNCDTTDFEVFDIPLPPPPPPPVSLSSKCKKSVEDIRQELFAQINKGLDITKGLKKVTPDMQVHKNPSLRTATPVCKPAVAAKPAHLTKNLPSAKKDTTKPPVLTCDDKKWLIENHVDNKDIKIEITDMKQVMYIYRCENCVIVVKGKLNSIALDSCKKTSLLFDNIVSSLEIINCQKMQIQTMGTMPTLVLQKTDGCMVYLSKEALNCEVITSKTSEINLLIPTEDGEFEERCVPEQFKTVWSGTALKTTPSEIA
ncbi:Adenylyl cyclase-associated protein 2 [Trichinella britovi]|uniref:Adenylyl cyclase-associated protein 2 n=1 Tax=Trichinella britovi TaxID=45882 RepID=A0A0V1D9Y5_TRIBR|nr:Adenylyl cyclase-associated protein 2 [Trichinella britovi]